MINFIHKIKNSVGLHARPAKMLVAAAKKLDSNITIKYNNKTAPATSLIKLISLGATTGVNIEVVIENGDENTSFETIKKLLDENV